MSSNFHALHQEGTFLLVNVHDAGTAAIAEAAGAVALGTTSSGHAYSIGRRDAEGALSKGEAVERAAQICAAVDIPVSVDAENGWGHEPEDVASIIRELADIGAAGASIEDWSGDASIGFYDRAKAVERIVAAVETVESLDRPFVICARAEALLQPNFYDGDLPAIDEALHRLQAFSQVGADCVYAPGIRDLDTFARFVAEAGGPINALLGVGGSITMDDARRIGIRRVSVGGSLFRATMAAFRQNVTQFLDTGSFTVDPAPIPNDEISGLFPPQTLS